VTKEDGHAPQEQELLLPHTSVVLNLFCEYW